MPVPRLLNAYAVSPSELRLAFDVPIVITAAAEATCTPLDVPAVPAEAATWMVDGNVATATLNVELSPSRRYEVLVVGMTDAAGVAVAPPFDRATFIAAMPRPSRRRFELWSMLPKHVRRDDASGDLARFVACLQDVVDLLLADIDAWPRIFDLSRAPESFMSAILADLGNPFPPPADLDAKRHLAAALTTMYREKGTAVGIENALRFLFGIESDVLPYSAEGLTLDESELGVDWVVGPGASWGRYAFDVEVSRVLTTDERQQVRDVVTYARPGHTHFVNLIEPGPPPPSDDWILDVGKLSADAVLVS